MALGSPAYASTYLDDTPLEARRQVIRAPSGVNEVLSVALAAKDIGRCLVTVQPLTHWRVLVFYDLIRFIAWFFTGIPKAYDVGSAPVVVNDLLHCDRVFPRRCSSYGHYPTDSFPS